MTPGVGAIDSGSFSHDLLLHDHAGDLVAEVRAFIGQGLASGGHVIVHGTQERMTALRQDLGSHPRLEYGRSEDLLRSPVATLFAAQRRLAQGPESTPLWAVGIVPPNDDPTAPSPARFESLMNEILGCHPFHALCAYGTRTQPGTTIAVAKATHPCLSGHGLRTVNPDYQEPDDFLTNPLAALPMAPDIDPTSTASLRSLQDLKWARDILENHAARSAVPRSKAADFRTAVNEVVVNALVHGAAPVLLTLWVEPARLTCRVDDAGPGIPDPLAGCRYPEPSGALGLWVARQSSDDLVIRNLPGGGASVLLIAGS